MSDTDPTMMEDSGGEEPNRPARSSVPDLPPDLIKGYELTKRLAEGGMGTVFLARQLSLDRTVAIKVLKPQLAKNSSFLRRFEREARAVAALNHRHVVTAIDVGESRGWHYLVMEYVDGPTLSELLTEHGKLPEREAIKVVWQVCAALRHAHGHGFVHRDIKPDNVILTARGDAKLCDLGLAKEVEGQSTVLTVVGTAMGTPMYISPEQARGGKGVDIRSDVYSLGATFYHMVCGCPPFDAPTAAVLMAMHLTEPPVPVQMRNAEISGGTAHVIEKMLEKDPADRYQTPNDVMKELRLVASGRWKPPRPPVEPRPEVPNAPAPQPQPPQQPQFIVKPKRRRRRRRR